MSTVSRARLGRRRATFFSTAVLVASCTFFRGDVEVHGLRLDPTLCVRFLVAERDSLLVGLIACVTQSSIGES
jgi:hypothetical protein